MQNFLDFFKQVCKRNYEKFRMLQNLLKIFFTCMRNFLTKFFAGCKFFPIFKKNMQNTYLFFLMQMQKTQNFFVKNLLNFC